MDPLSNESNGMELPPPLAERPAADVAGQLAPEQGRPAGPEKASNAPAISAPAASVPLPAIPAMPAPMPAQAQPRQAPPVAPTAHLQASDDNDLIEKEWVSKAKQIVERTRDDPYKQTEALTLVKVDYMKKRYNKTIKLNK